MYLVSSVFLRRSGIHINILIYACTHMKNYIPILKRFLRMIDILLLFLHKFNVARIYQTLN